MISHQNEDGKSRANDQVRRNRPNRPYCKFRAYHSSGCYNKNAHISVRNFFLTVLEAETSRHQQIECLVGTHFLVHRQLSSHCVLVWQKGWGRSLGSLFQGHSSHSLGLHPDDFISKRPTSKCHHFGG